MAKRNAKRNFIAAMVRDDGSITSSSEQVADEFIGFYQKLLGIDICYEPILPSILRLGTSIPREQVNYLIRGISVQEIKDALFDIGDDKAPGPDGFSSYFL